MHLYNINMSGIKQSNEEAKFNDTHYTQHSIYHNNDVSVILENENKKRLLLIDTITNWTTMLRLLSLVYNVSN
jgi:hypothetical protein